MNILQAKAANKKLPFCNMLFGQGVELMGLDGGCIALLIAAILGVAMALQGTLNSLLGKALGLLPTTLIVHLVGLSLIAILFFIPFFNKSNWSGWKEVPWYCYLGGLLGVIIVYGVAKIIPLIGVAPASTAIIMGQILTASIIDHFGLFGMNKIPFLWSRVLGVFFMAGGAWLLLKR